MNQELLRLATFSSWPETAKASPVRLAKAGLYFNGQGDTTVCFRCSSSLDNWQEGDDPAERHRHRSSNCPLVLGNDNENVPLRLYQCSAVPDNHEKRRDQERDIPDDTFAEDEPRRQSIGISSVYNFAVSRAQERELFEATSALRIDRTSPDFDQLRLESVRLSTFHDWPPRAHAQPAELAREGFFFTGLYDRVQCAFCHGFIRNWVPGDNITDEHKKHFPECPFVRGDDAGNVLSERQNHLTEVCDTGYLIYETLTGSVKYYWCQAPYLTD